MLAFSTRRLGHWNTWSGEVLPTSCAATGYAWGTRRSAGNTLSGPGGRRAMMDHGDESSITIERLIRLPGVALLAVECP